MIPGARVHVHERVVRLDGRVIGSHVLHGGTGAITGTAVRSFELVAEARGWTARHPGDWKDEREQVSRAG